MRIRLKILSVLLLLPVAACVAATKVAEEIRFDRDIRPILSENCFLCHGMDPNKRKAKLRLEDRDVAIAKGAIVPGKPDESELIKRILSTDAEYQIPPPASNRRL